MLSTWEGERTQLRSALQQRRSGNKPAENLHSRRRTASTVLITWEPATLLSPTSGIDTETEGVDSLNDGIRRSRRIVPQLDTVEARPYPPPCLNYLGQQALQQRQVQQLRRAWQSAVRTTVRWMRQT